ncbi:hypothetical protein BROUX41_000624 [Berkeleyomyces rouxiae]
MTSVVPPLTSQTAGLLPTIPIPSTATLLPIPTSSNSTSSVAASSTSAAPSASSEPASDSSDGGGSSTGAKVGIIGGTVAGIAILAFAVWVILRRRGRGRIHHSSDGDVEESRQLPTTMRELESPSSDVGSGARHLPTGLRAPLLTTNSHTPASVDSPVIDRIIVSVDDMEQDTNDRRCSRETTISMDSPTNYSPMSTKDIPSPIVSRHKSILRTSHQPSAPIPRRSINTPVSRSSSKAHNFASLDCPLSASSVPAPIPARTTSTTSGPRSRKSQGQLRLPSPDAISILSDQSYSNYPTNGWSTEEFVKRVLVTDGMSDAEIRRLVQEEQELDRDLARGRNKRLGAELQNSGQREE